MLKFLKRLLAGLRDNTNVRRALRGAGMTFLGLFVPGLLGWLNQLTGWAPGVPFPDLHPLGALFVSSLLAAVVGLVNLVVNALETATGVAVLRTVPSTTQTDLVNARPDLSAAELPAVLVDPSKGRHLPDVAIPE